MARELSSVALVAATAGCMTGPTVQSIPSPAQSVAVEGYTLAGGRTVRVECKQVGVRSRTSLGTTASEATPTPTRSGAPVFYWSKNVGIPASCWVPVAPGAAATRLYAVDEDEGLGMLHVEDLLCVLTELSDGTTPALAGPACAERFAHRELRAPSGLAVGTDPLAGMGAVQTLATGLGWAEGPLWDADDGALVLSDVASDRILRLESGVLSTLAEGTGAYTNGLDYDADGHRLECQHGAQRVVRRAPDGTTTAVAAAFQGAPFNSPNDVIAHASGAIFFTDPTYGSLPQLGAVAPQQPWQGVYRVALDTGVVTLVDDARAQPNGIALSPDHATLYVTDTASGEVVAYPVAEDGTAGAGTVLVALAAPDGMAVDVDGNLYVATGAGVAVLRPDGTSWGTIALPEAPTNVAFGDADRRSLYATTPSAVHRVVLGVPGLPASF